MKSNVLNRLYRLFIIFNIFTLLALALPQSVYAATPSVKILSVKADDSVTVKAAGFPTGQTITARMDVAGKNGLNGIVVGETNSGTKGEFEATYKIPAELKGKYTITIRLESATGGWFAYDWFNNKTSSSTTTGTTSGTTTTTTGSSPFIKIVAVDQNERITVRATGFPADVTFTVKVGPYFDFRAKGVVVDTVYTKKGGTFDFNVDLPDTVQNVELVTVRVESPKFFVYNAFKNVDTGTISTSTTEDVQVVRNACQIVSTAPSQTKSMSPRFDFDGAWEIKNTSGKDWIVSDVDYKYVKGDKLHIHDSVYNLPKTVKDGETIKIIVDMMAPEKAGTYTTEWGLVIGSTVLCDLPLTITVK